MTATLSEPDLSPAASGDTCSAFPRSGSGRCGGEAVVTVIVGCVHEHLLRRPVCQFHVERLADGRAICRLCFRADGHDCEMHLLREIPTP